MQSYMQQAAEKYKEVERLTAELKIEKVQYKRTALRTNLEIARLEWQNFNLLAKNEELEANALKVAMAQKVRFALNTKENVESTVKQAAREMKSRLDRLSENLGVYIENNRIESLLYAMMSELPVILGNSSFDGLSRYRAELAQAQQILDWAKEDSDV